LSHHLPAVVGAEVVTATELDVVVVGLVVDMVVVDVVDCLVVVVVVVVIVDVPQDASSIAAAIKTLRPNQITLFFNSFLLLLFTYSRQ
jgi:hypothetical protein